MAGIVCISGSCREESSTRQLLLALARDERLRSAEMLDLHRLPLFVDGADLTPAVEDFRASLAAASAVIIATPEYIHNIPAALKNALETVTASGDLHGKRVLAITYTPHPPRGSKAMQSLLWSLKALEVQVVASMEIYHSEVQVVDGQLAGDQEVVQMLEEAVALLL